VVTAAFLIVEGILQNQEGVVSVRADSVKPLCLAATAPHDFH
jgi:hypothetical protein